MHWIRARLKSSSYAALFALAIQFVICFGHVHLEGIRGHRADVTSIAVPGSTSTTDQGSDGVFHHCPVCALIHLAGATLIPQLAALPVPIAFDQGVPVATAGFGSAISNPASFSTRAPPIG
jgi:hypothetical protein